MVRADQVGLQCYTIRDHCKTEADFAESMAKAAKIGALHLDRSAGGREPSGGSVAHCCCCVHE